MKAFMDDDFLLETETARTLYHDYAARMPIIDYHCHIDPVQIADNVRYDSITSLFLGGDHYKWRAMRCNGIPERRITGAKDTDPFDAFCAWAETLPRCIGNPLYHWTYLELKNYFGVREALTPDTARSIYDRCNARLRDADMDTRGIIRQSNVCLICTTDDPVDDLSAHARIANDPSCTVRVLPAFRPDKALNIDKPGFPTYAARLSAVVGFPIRTFFDLTRALADRIAYFDAHGCRTADHGLDYAVYTPASESELDAILTAGLSGPVDAAAGDRFKTALLCFLAEEYHRRGWVMQLHYGCLRNNSARMLAAIGPDTGFDCMGDAGGIRALSGLLNHLEQADSLPKMVLYSLNPQDNEPIATLAGCFQTDGECPSKIQLGAAWWFNDHKTGMLRQLTDLAALGTLGSFIGMLTDSRSLLSYTRHEYFRRILCNLIGCWAAHGEVHPDLPALGQLVQDICFHNVVRFFGFDLSEQETRAGSPASAME